MIQKEHFKSVVEASRGILAKSSVSKMNDKEIRAKYHEEKHGV